MGRSASPPPPSAPSKSKSSWHGGAGPQASQEERAKERKNYSSEDESPASFKRKKSEKKQSREKDNSAAGWSGLECRSESLDRIETSDYVADAEDWSVSWNGNVGIVREVEFTPNPSLSVAVDDVSVPNNFCT
jgi:hypothetical protein